MGVDRKTEELSDESYASRDVDDSIDSLSNDTSFAENLKTSLDIKTEKDKRNVKNLDQLKAELSKKMEKIKDEKGMTTWKCKECGKMMKNKNKLELHVEIHLQGFSHTCPHCGKSHKNRGSLKAHKSVIHRNTK